MASDRHSDRDADGAHATGGDAEAARLAEVAAAVMWADDEASRALGMRLVKVAPGRAEIVMAVTQAMANGHGIAHGGYIFTLADSAFGYAANSHNNRCVAQHCSITFLEPALVGDELRAVATEVTRRGRSGIYDIVVTSQKGERIAEFRGHSRQIRGVHVTDAAG
jgi:acyl-CoA thioesterase